MLISGNCAAEWTIKKKRVLLQQHSLTQRRDKLLTRVVLVVLRTFTVMIILVRSNSVSFPCFSSITNGFVANLADASEIHSIITMFGFSAF